MAESAFCWTNEMSHCPTASSNAIISIIKILFFTGQGMSGCHKFKALNLKYMHTCTYTTMLCKFFRKTTWANVPVNMTKVVRLVWKTNTLDTLDPSHQLSFPPASVYVTRTRLSYQSVEDRLTKQANEPARVHKTGTKAVSGHSDRDLIGSILLSGKSNWFDSTQEAM